MNGDSSAEEYPRANMAWKQRRTSVCAYCGVLHREEYKLVRFPVVQKGEDVHLALLVFERAEKRDNALA